MNEKALRRENWLLRRDLAWALDLARAGLSGLERARIEDPRFDIDARVRWLGDEIETLRRRQAARGPANDGGAPRDDGPLTVHLPSRADRDKGNSA